jgi:hypothetical protein
MTEQSELACCDHGQAAQVLVEGEERLARNESSTYPARSNWPSFVGHPCARYVFYRRTHHDVQAPVDAGRSRVFWLGRALERVAADRVAAALDGTGWTLEQLPDSMNRFQMEPNISGKVDRLLQPPHDGKVPHVRPLVVEIKGVTDYVLDDVNTLEDMLERPEPWWQSYPAQVWCYEEAGYRAGWTQRDGVFVLLGKLSGRLKVVPAPFNEGRWGLLMQRLEDMESRVELWPKCRTQADRDELTPPRIPGMPGVCARCDYATICHPPMAGGQGGGVITDPAVLEQLGTYLRLRSQAEMADKAKEALRAWALRASGDEDAVWLADGLGQVLHRMSTTTVYDVPKDVREQYKGKAARHTVRIEGLEK